MEVLSTHFKEYSRSSRLRFMVPVILLISCVYNLSAQQLTATFGSNRFRHSDTLCEYEYYLRIPAGAVNFVTTPENKIQATVNCKVDILQDGDLKYQDNFNLSSPAVDSLVTFRHFNAQRRTYVKPGEYTINVEVKDLNTDNAPIKMSDELSITFPNDKMSFSDVQFLESYVPAAAGDKGPDVRNGFKMVTHNSKFFPNEETKLKYFFEMYNVTKTMGEGNDFVLFFGVEMAGNYRKVENIGKFVKLKSQETMAQMGEIDISGLPSGNYNFFVEVRNRKNQLLLVKRKDFQRSNPSQDNLENISVDQTFAAKMDFKTLKYYIPTFSPIATDDELRNIKIVQDSDDTTMVQSFFYSFWHKRYPDAAQYNWEKYRKLVDYTDEELSPSTKRGYLTDLGRVYLKYGPPNRVEDERNDPQRTLQGTTTPYQIWYYYNIPQTNQTNRLFVFVNPAKVGYEYRMIHSNVRGENFIDDWLGHTRWKALLQNYTGTERLDYSRDDNRFNDGYQNGNSNFR